MKTTESKIADAVQVDANGCWLWQQARNNAGYGQMSLRGSTVFAHRLSYEITHGPIPDGLVIDHLCRVRHCVNPDHLEPVTNRENVLRSPISLAAINSAKTHCRRGHEYTPSNTRVYCGRPGATMRICRTCDRENVRAYRARRVAAVQS